MSAALPLGARLILYFAVLISVPLLAVGAANYRLLATFTEELVTRQKRDVGTLSLEQIELLRLRDEKSSDEILLNPAVQERLQSPAPAGELALHRARRDLEPVLAGVVESNQSLGIAIVTAGGEVYRSDEGLGSSAADLPELHRILEHPDLRASRGGNLWIPLGVDVLRVPPIGADDEGPWLYLARRVKSLSRAQQDLGVSIIQFDYGRMARILRSAASGPGEWCLLSDGRGMVLWDTRDARLAGSPVDGGLPDPGVARTARGELVLTVPASPGGWRLTLGVPTENLLGPFRRVQGVTAIFLGAFLAASIAVGVLLSRSITGPIGRLSDLMRRFGSGELGLRSGVTREDEIGRLERSFDHMAGEIGQLLETVEQEHRRRRKLELDVLEYQINPHFLYNILDSINWMAQKAGHREMGEMVTALARFFRIGLSGGRDMITVAEELEHARNYLLISRMRYRDCFRYDIEVEEGVERLRTLKILLQPLLENALNHGLDKASRDGVVRVSCRRAEDDLLYVVQDNGRGITPERLESIRSGLARGEAESGSDGGFGLVNVSERIRLHYGEGYGIELESRVGDGTTVTIRIPRQE